MTATRKPMGATVSELVAGRIAGGSAPVPCGSCRACCTGYDVTPEPADTDLGLFTDRTKDGTPRLPQTDGGRCAYLGADGCTVYERRPAACYRYDCRPFAVSMTLVRGKPALSAAIAAWDVLGAIRSEKDARTAVGAAMAARWILNRNPDVPAEDCALIGIDLAVDSPIGDKTLALCRPGYDAVARMLPSIVEGAGE